MEDATENNPPDDRLKSKPKSKTVTWFTVIVLFTLALAIFLFKNFKTVVVSGVSMKPTFRNGQRVLVSHAYWLIGPIKRNDIVVVNDIGAPGYIIKRVKFMGGDTVEPLLAPADHLLTDPPYVVPEGYIYLLGDNSFQSEDSRKFGPVPLSSVLGKVVTKP